MAGKISWKLEIVGLEGVIRQLKEIDRILARITSRKSGVFLGMRGIKSLEDLKEASARNKIFGVGRGPGEKIAPPEVAKDFIGPIQEKFLTESEKAKRANFPKIPPPVIQPQTIAQQITSAIKSIRTGNLPAGAGNIATALSAISAVSTAFIALKMMLDVVIQGIKVAFDLLKKGIENGAKAFMEGAKLAGRVGKVFQLESAMSLLGINEQETSLMVQQAMFNRKSRVFAPEDAQRLIGAARVSQFGSVQQLTNMAEEFRFAMNDARDNARQMELSSRSSFLLSLEMKAVFREFNTLITQTVTALSPFLNLLFTLMKGLLDNLNSQMEIINKILEFLHLIPTGQPGQARTMGMASIGSNITGWERIGFLFNASSRDTAMQQIAQNTRESAEYLKKIASMYSGKSGALAQPSNFGLPMLPSMP